MADKPSEADLARRRMLAALAGEDLTPETTSDDRPEPTAEPSRDREFEENRPPHHG